METFRWIVAILILIALVRVIIAFVEWIIARKAGRRDVTFTDILKKS